MTKKFLFLIVLFQALSINSFAFSEIVPLKKPIQTKEETQKKLLIDVLRPLPKPIKKTEIKEIKELLDSGAIDDDEFKQMKKEILGK